MIQSSHVIITKQGENVKNMFKRLKSQKGMSGVLVALLLVIVGVGLIAALNTFMQDATDRIISDSNSTITDTLNDINDTN